MDLDVGRTEQKLRTRRALLLAARRLLDRHEAVTVTAAAAEAMISKATAYRYFSTSEALVREALLDAGWKTPEEVVGNSMDVRERVLRVHRYLFAFTRRNETAHRLFLAKALEAWVAEGGKPKALLRGARRLPMFELALEPMRGALPASSFKLLLYSLSAASGIETYIALKDVCGLSDKEADRVSSETLLGVLDRALGPHPPQAGRRAPHG
jgi:AcrR family transcriptional regulator